MNPENAKISMNSRKKLTDALFTVMKQYSYKEITITQIAQEAGLSRKTFYRLYTSKEEILNEYIETIYSAFFNELKKRNIHHYWEVVQLYFDFWEQQEAMILLFKQHELLPALMEASRNHAEEIFSAVRSPETAASFSPLLPFMLAYTVGGMHNMLVSWITGGKSVSSTMLIQSIKSGLQSPEI